MIVSTGKLTKLAKVWLRRTDQKTLHFSARRELSGEALTFGPVFSQVVGPGLFLAMYDLDCG